MSRHLLLRPPARRRLLGTAAALAISLVLAGCSSGRSSGSSTSATTKATATSTTAATPPGSPKLLDAGDAPRRPLRLTYLPDTSTTIEVTTTVKATTTTGGQTRTSTPAPTTSAVRYHVDRSDDTGAELTATVVRAPGTDTELQGLQATLRVSARGQTDALTVRGGATLTDAQRALLSSLASSADAFGAVLPVEAVGVGARWSVQGTTTVAGATMDATTTYELTKVEGSKIGYTASVSIKAADQPIDLPGTSADQAARLRSATITGTVEGTMRLDRPERDSTATTTGTEEITVTGPDGTVDIVQRLDITTTATPVDR